MRVGDYRIVYEVLADEGGLNVDLDANRDVVGFEIDHASKRLDLSTLETEALPVRAYKVG